MGFDPNEPEQRRRLREAMKASDVSVPELWLRYFGIAGDAGEYEVEAYLQGMLSFPSTQRDLLAMAANELIDEIARPRAPLSGEFKADGRRDATSGSTDFNGGNKEDDAGAAGGKEAK
ncbi:hypothetical protein J7I92_20865 [Arthrobacter sp. ISL-72]|nr:hypothetical protein [Arthrobacter sp. ISL-72]